jgi:hypothetical protein
MTAAGRPRVAGHAFSGDGKVTLSTGETFIAADVAIQADAKAMVVYFAIQH